VKQPALSQRVRAHMQEAQSRADEELQECSFCPKTSRGPIDSRGRSSLPVEERLLLQHTSARDARSACGPLRWLCYGARLTRCHLCLELCIGIGQPLAVFCSDEFCVWQ
jgi:hypothetical protein